MVEARKQSGSFDADLARGELLLLMSADNLKKGIEYAVSQLHVRKVRGQMKLRWMRSLTRQVEALVKVVQALSNIGSKSGANIDLATFLSSVEKEIREQPCTSPSISPAATECRIAIRRASLDMSGMRRATARHH